MAPNTEIMILDELKAIRSQLSEQGESIASLKSTIEADRRFCSDCKQAINKDIDILYERMRQTEIEGAANAGADGADTKRGRIVALWLTTIAALLSAGGAWVVVLRGGHG